MKKNRTIGRAAVLGAGVMGSGIAALLAAVGIEVWLLDIVPSELSDADKAMGLTDESPDFRNRIAAAGRKRMSDKKSGLLYSKNHLDRIRVGNLTDDLHRLSDCDWILEVVVENLDVKRDLMRRIERVRKPDAIVSTNTSGVSVNAIAEGRSPEFRKHFLGTHFFNPPRYMHLFEIIPIADTAPEILAFMEDFAANHLGKGVVLAKDTPGFVGNRIGAYITMRTAQLTREYGYSFPLADQLTGTVLGRPKSATFRTLDMVGLDIFVNVARNLAAHTDADERALFTLPGYIEKQFAEGALGDKTGGGFYKKSKADGKKVVLVRNRETGAYETSEQTAPDCVKQALGSGNKYEAIVYGDARENKFAWECLKSALLYSAAKVPEIADDFRLIDKAMVWGYNWEKGPFAIWDEIGLARSAARMKAEGDCIPDWIEQKLANGDNRFYKAQDEKSPYIRLGDVPTVAQNGAARLSDLGDGVACLEFTSKGNAIDTDTMDMFDEALDRLEAGEFLGLVVGNHGKNFSAGANLARIGALAAKGDTDTIRNLVGRLQATMLRMKYAPRPVAAAPKGMTLGGGMEITLHAAAVCAHAETYMGLVEAGVGLVPGAGGCKELLCRAVAGYALHDKASMLLAVKKLWKNVATATVSAGAFDAADIGYLRRTDAVQMNADRLLDVAKARVLSMAAEGYHPPAKRGIPVLGEFGRAAILFDLRAMQDGGFVSRHDALVAGKIAYVLTGGGVPAGATVSEEHLLELEKEAFVALCGEGKTLQRISHMLAVGKPLRN